MREGERESQGDFEVSRLAISTLLMHLIETKAVLDVEYFSVRGL